MRIKICFLTNFFSLLFILNCFSSQAQQDSISSYQLGIKGGYGFILSHNEVMQYITEQHISKLEINFEKNTSGTASWQQRYGFPRIGYSLSYFDLNNKKHLGNAFAFAPHLNFRILGTNRVQLRLKTAIGIGFIQEVFNTEDNFKNSAIGSNFNLFFSIASETEILLHRNSGILIGINFSHFSNTSFKKPNLGINIPTIEAGLYHRFGKNKMIRREVQPSFNRKKAKWLISFGGGINEINPPNGRKYFASGISIANEKRLNYKSSIGASFDLAYNPAQIDALKRSMVSVDKGWENLRVGVSFYHVFHFGKLDAFTQAGYYLKTKDEELGNYYHLVGGRYQFNSKWNGLMALKTHFAKAEYLLFGVGLKLGQNEN